MLIFLKKHIFFVLSLQTCFLGAGYNNTNQHNDDSNIEIKVSYNRLGKQAHRMVHTQTTNKSVDNSNALNAAIKKIILKDDSFQAVRGKPQLLNLSCSQCEQPICLYQKDGPGRLLRCYLDRIHYPQNLKDLVSSYNTFDDMQKLVCSHCNATIGQPMYYESENRLAFKMIQQAFTITIVK